jgi:uncharacterized BrkB/YihY/UPF0761 family membrane protein
VERRPQKQRRSALIEHPGDFAWRTLKAFRANQGLLLAGAVAYYALLSIVPLLILSVIALSHVIDRQELLQTLGRYLEWLVPGQSGAIVTELAYFLLHRPSSVVRKMLRLPRKMPSSARRTLRSTASSIPMTRR